MPDELRIATAQFENRSRDKDFNLTAIEELSARAALLGANVIAFHECSITGYSFARRLSKDQLWDLAELVPGGASTAALSGIARRHGIIILAGLFEQSRDLNYPVGGSKYGVRPSNTTTGAPLAVTP
jgi:5-aminopentanamidase